MSDAGLENDGTGGLLRRLALVWQVPVLILAVVAWMLFIGVNRAQHVPEPVTDQEILGDIKRDFDEGRFRQALEPCRRFLDAFPQHSQRTEVLFWLGQSAFEVAGSFPGESEEVERLAVASLLDALKEGLEVAEALSARKSLALIYMGRGEYLLAAPLIAEISEEDGPGSVGLLTGLGRAYFRAGKPELAEKTLQKALTNSKPPEERVAVMMCLGQGLRQGGTSQRAEEVFRRILREQPESPLLKRVYFELGRALADQGKYKPARDTFTRVMKLEPVGDRTACSARFHAADCARELGLTGEAEREFAAIATKLEGAEESVGARMRLAGIYLNSGRWGAARAELSRLLGGLADGARLRNSYASDTELRSMWNEVLHNFLRESDFEEARRFISEGVKRGRKDVLLYSEGLTYQHEADARLAQVERLRERGLTHEAEKMSLEVRKLRLRAAKVFLKIVNNVEMARSDLFGKAVWRAANCLYESGDYAHAVVYYGLFHSSVDNDDQRGRARMQYGRAMAALGSHEEAIQNFESVLTEFPGTLHASEAQYAKGLSYLKLAQLSEARKVFESIVGNEKELTTKASLWKRSLPLLGYVCYRSGDHRAAVDKLDEALIRGLSIPDCPLGMDAVVFCLAESLRLAGTKTLADRRGNLKRAVELYEKFTDATKDIEQPNKLVLQMKHSSCFARAGCLFELGEYALAAGAYREVSERYARSAGAVTALHRLATCYERLGRIRDAGETRQLAQWAAGRLGADNGTAKDDLLVSCWQALTEYSSMTFSSSVAQEGTPND